MKNSLYFLIKSLRGGREREPEFEKWSHVYACELIINVRLFHIVLNVNLFWLYLSLNFTMRGIRSLDQNSDLISALGITSN